MRHPIGTILAAGLAAAVVVACQPTDQQEGAQETAVDTAAIEATFDSIRTAFEEAVAAGDFDAQAALFAEDAVYSPPMEPPARGRDEIRAAIERTTPPGATLEISPMDTGVLGPDVVYEFGTSLFTFTPEGSEAEQTVEGSYLVLFRRTADGWRLTHEVASLNAPPAGGGQ